MYRYARSKYLGLKYYNFELLIFKVYVCKATKFEHLKVHRSCDPKKRENHSLFYSILIFTLDEHSLTRNSVSK